MMIGGQLLFLYFQKQWHKPNAGEIWHPKERRRMWGHVGTGRYLEGDPGGCNMHDCSSEEKNGGSTSFSQGYKPIEKRKYAEPVESMEAWQDQTVGAKGLGVVANGAAPDDSSSTKWPGHISDTRNEQRWKFSRRLWGPEANPDEQECI